MTGFRDKKKNRIYKQTSKSMGQKAENGYEGQPDRLKIEN